MSARFRPFCDDHGRICKLPSRCKVLSRPALPILYRQEFSRLHATVSIIFFSLPEDYPNKYLVKV
jgi:hypothetical protein